MARRSWGIRNYNTFLRKAKKRFDIPHGPPEQPGTAQWLYREARAIFGRSMYGVDVDRETPVLQAALDGEALASGAEVEMSIDVEYESSEATRRNLHLKMRVRLRRAMSKTGAAKLIRMSVLEGRVPPMLDLYWMDWQKGEGGAARGGDYLDDAAEQALHDFYGALQSSRASLRIAVADRGY